MITEDYVSFQIAKVLKEKDFDKDVLVTDWWYDEKGDAHKHQNYSYSGAPVYYKETCCHAPTLQMAMKWLREVHNLVIEPYRTACGYLYTVSTVPYGSTKYDNSESFNGDDEDSGQWTTWEKACEDGVKYCLENLI